jgi:hypothetical protein
MHFNKHKKQALAQREQFGVEKLYLQDNENYIQR